MKNVQPIRDKDQIEMLKDYLKEWNPRNFLLLVFGLNSGLRISDILPLKVKEMFNHSSPDITLRYIGINQEEQDKEVADFSL